MFTSSATPEFPQIITFNKTQKAAEGFCFAEGSDFKASGYQTSRKACSGDGLETGRFQPTGEPNKCDTLHWRLSGWRFGRYPVGAEGLSVSLVRAAYLSDKSKAKSWRRKIPVISALSTQ